MKIKYSKGELPAEDAQFIGNALKADCQVWLSGVELTLEEFSSLELLPSRILLCGGGSSLPEIEQTLKNAVWSTNLPFARQPTVHFIRPKDVANIVDQTEELINPWDITPMSLANLAIDLVGEEAVMDSILNKIVVSLRE